MIFSLIKLVMKECGLTQTALAEVLGVNLDRVKSITSGRAKELRREESEALVKKLNIRAEWLVTGEGPMFRAEDAPAEARQVSESGRSADEAALLAAYRRSTPSIQEAALRMLNATGPSAVPMPAGLKMRSGGPVKAVSPRMRSGDLSAAKPASRKKQPKGGSE